MCLVDFISGVRFIYIFMYYFHFFFFFSSRRRHTRCSRDWSSDVCSSDLRRFGGRWARATTHEHSTGRRRTMNTEKTEYQLIMEAGDELRRRGLMPTPAREIGRASCRERV